MTANSNKISRDERQDLMVRRWLENKGRSSVVAATGFGCHKKETAVLVEESLELQSGNIGESPIKDNTEINLEIKESKSSYSVEGETK